MLSTIDEEEKVCENNAYALQGQQEQWFLTEDGLYEVLMQSRKPIAKKELLFFCGKLGSVNSSLKRPLEKFLM